VQCLWIEFLLSVGQESRGLFRWQPDEAAAILYIMLAFLAAWFSAQAIVIFKLGAGRSWARYVFLVTTILRVVQYVPSLPREWFTDGLSVGLTAFQFELDCAALFLVFTSPGKEWFKKRAAG
jgi:hypothetical protein